MRIAGYGYCRVCDHLTPQAILERSTGLCEECIVTANQPRPVVLLRIGASTLPLVPRRRRRTSKGARRTKASTRRAHHAALKRLRDCFPDLYRALYVMERARQGLPPVPLYGTAPIDDEALLRAVVAAGANLDREAFYAQLMEQER